MIKNNRDLVSVLIGTYNRANLLVRCVDSIFQQTHDNIEVIIINDASLDNTQQVLKSLKVKYGKQLKYVSNSENRGIAYNSNLAFEYSSGDYIALIGDDDYWIEEDKLDKQIKVLQEDDNLGVVGTWWMEKSDNDEIQKAPKEPKNWKSKLLAGGGIICGSTPLIPKNVWIEVGGFDKKMKRGTDSELFRRIILKGYSAKIIKTYSTIVDISHIDRMTPQNSRKAFLYSIQSHSLNIKKYWKYYLIYPNSFYKRIKSLFSVIVKIIRSK